MFKEALACQRKNCSSAHAYGDGSTLSLFTHTQRDGLWDLHLSPTNDVVLLSPI